MIYTIFLFPVKPRQDGLTNLSSAPEPCECSALRQHCISLKRLLLLSSPHNSHCPHLSSPHTLNHSLLCSLSPLHPLCTAACWMSALHLFNAAVDRTFPLHCQYAHTHTHEYTFSTHIFPPPPVKTSENFTPDCFPGAGYRRATQLQHKVPFKRMHKCKLRVVLPWYVSGVWRAVRTVAEEVQYWIRK